jgi:hypothetical protein
MHLRDSYYVTCKPNTASVLTIPELATKYFVVIIIVIIISGVRLSPFGTAATTCLLYQPKMIDNGDCRAMGGMKIGRGNRSTRRKPALAPLCPPQIPHDLTRARTRTAAVGSQRLTAWAMSRPLSTLLHAHLKLQAIKSLEGRKETLWLHTKVHILQLIVHKTPAVRISS